MRLLIAILALSVAPALAKLPPLSDEAKAKNAETAAKSAWADKVGAYQTCRADDRVADAYRKNLKASGQPVPAPVAMPPCTDPGPYVSQEVAKPKPLEASGAHSPPETATSPPSSTATQKELSGNSKR